MTVISMIDIDTWPLTVVANVFGGGFLVACLCLLGNIYISQKYLERMLKAFERSPEAKMWAAAYNRGLFGKILLVGLLANLILLSERYIKSGDVSAQDIQDLPRDLKRIFLIDGILMCVSPTIIIVLGVLVDLRSGG
ncbi:MAG: hypothetical protein ACN6QH_20825 [Pseudomonas sp.]|uniref:hypothetical protein n=1 Tax=Pseudomonas sp. TaxID=306 RepID=UPI003D128B4F